MAEHLAVYLSYSLLSKKGGFVKFSKVLEEKLEKQLSLAKFQSADVGASRYYG